NMTTLPFVFFFSSRRRHTRFSRDWSSDVCSSDLTLFDITTEAPAATTAAGPPALTIPTVYGLDLSLTCSGISDGTTADALIPGTRTGHDRLEYHRRSIRERIPEETSLVVIEGPAMSLGYRPGVEEMTY